MYKYLLIGLLLSDFYTFSQTKREIYDLKDPMPDYAKNCVRCLEVMKIRPAELRIGIHRTEDGKLFFYLNNPAWFDKLFQKAGDGVTVDIVDKKQYSCNKPIAKGSPFGKGVLIKPVYLKELKSNIITTPNNEILIPIGEIPEKMRKGQLEFNMILISNKFPCHTNIAIDIPQYKWGLLDMGMYMDTITYKSDLMSKDSSVTYYIHSKRLKFIVPFEKNKYEFSPTDVKPIYDSLNFSDYYISRIEIRAYSSVEGSEEKNMELQTKRCESLIKALQTYQKENITTKIETAENWVEFLNDITGTSYSYLSSLTKQEIKKKLEDKQLSNSLEPFLSKHRKGVLIFDLEKKNALSKMSTVELKALFDKSIAEKNMQRAKEVQEAIFDKIKDHSIPENFLHQLEIPKRVECGALLNDHEAFTYLMEQKDVYESLMAFEDLKDLFPNDGKIRYNITVLKFRLWLERGEDIKPTEFKKEIEDLRKFGISARLITRMLINYNIIMSEQALRAHDYARKDEAIKYIYNNYTRAATKPADILSLAQYFTVYSKFDWGVKIMDPYVKAIDGDEDLIFYYLTLTLLKPKITATPDYRKIMLNAINMNRSRFCQMFEPSGKGGVSFQLLEDEFLRKGYCENCK